MNVLFDQGLTAVGVFGAGAGASCLVLAAHAIIRWRSVSAAIVAS
jgi:hypothetical protein